MKHLIVYDAEGNVIMSASGDYGECKTTTADVPVGYYVESVNPETGEPVLKENPKTEEQQKIADLETKQAEDDERYIDQEYRLTLLELGLIE